MTDATHPRARHTIAIAQVERILLGARQRGADVHALLERAGIAPALLGAPLSRVTQAQYACLTHVLRRSLRDELWGLCSRPVPVGSFAQAGRLLVGCRSLGEALELGLRQYRLQIDDFVPRLQLHGEMATVSVSPRHPPGPAQSYAQRVFSFLAYGLASWLVGRRIPLLAVDYPATAERPASEAAAVFQAPVRYGGTRTAWHFGAGCLALPVVQDAQSLRAFLRQAPASLLIKYRDQSSVTERIRRLLRHQLAGELPSLADIGRQLDMTPQTLRRRLRDEGQPGFQAIKDDLRRDVAIECLARPEMALPEIAGLLGFSEASTFHRAFKHWTGVAPGAYRQARLRNG
ncbi:AraC family transcriptional regulator [Pseudorhodoferax sp. Leaf267]|uniref:AraC family transcriptional regulator n=1 Tax=Pseudorhodoferax sp. Leaf267 TaxID=1736316 RepID=UPI001910DFE7|nr:AraC family transcriptional regulator [Pseudorhodoferax sp. Leaf267]